jgi:hypothetical protein
MLNAAILGCLLFGEPIAVSCVTQKLYAGNDVVHSRLIYDKLAVLATGASRALDLPPITEKAPNKTVK